MTRPTLANSLAAFADELHALDRDSRWAKMKAAFARSAAEHAELWRDTDAQQAVAHHLASAARLDGRHAALEPIRSRQTPTAGLYRQSLPTQYWACAIETNRLTESPHLNG